MTKAELVDQVAATVQLPKSQTDAVLTQCLQTIMDTLQAGVTTGALRLASAPRPTTRRIRPVSATGVVIV